MDVEHLRYQYENGYYGVVTKQKFKIGVRHIQMVYMFVGSVVIGVVRGSVGVAVLAMTDETRRNDTYIQIHNWDSRVQGAILSSFFFGYALMVAPAELYLKKLGGKLVFTMMLIVHGAFCVAMPTIANRGDWVAVCNAMMLMGMAQACFSSINQSLIKSWLPPSEKGIFNSLICGGVQFGIIIALPISGQLSQTRLGWELIYYSLAMMTLAMAVTYGTLTASSPQDHQAVGDVEKEYIKEALKYYRKKPLSNPWREIFKSSRFWAVACAHAASNAVFVFYLSEVPAYLKTFDISLKDSAWYSMFPFILMWIMYLTTAPTLDWLCNTRFISYILNITYYRKIINALGASGVLIGLTILPNLSPEWINLSIIVLTGVLGSLGFQLSGFLNNYRDMSENYSGTIMMISCTFSSAVGATVPFITGLMTGDISVDRTRWRPIFLTLSSLYVLCNVIYTALGSNERQSWDYVRTRTKSGYQNSVIDADQIKLDELTPKQLQEAHDNDIIL